MPMSKPYTGSEQTYKVVCTINVHLAHFTGIKFGFRCKIPGTLVALARVLRSLYPSTSRVSSVRADSPSYEYRDIICCQYLVHTFFS